MDICANTDASESIYRYIHIENYMNLYLCLYTSISEYVSVHVSA